MHRFNFLHSRIRLIDAVLCSLILIVATVAAIYLTPLKNITVIEPTIDDISATDFYALYSENPDDYVFLDVRTPASYNRLHAQGAQLMQLHTFYNERLNLPKNTDKTIVLICSGGVASGVAYHYLEHHGFFNIKRIEGGIESWEQAGLPVESQL